MKTCLFSLVLCLTMMACVPPGVAQEDTVYRRYRILSPVIQYHLFFMSTDYFPQFVFGADPDAIDPGWVFTVTVEESGQ